MELLGVVCAILTPAVLIALLGCLARRYEHISESGAQGVSRWTLNLFLPAFVFLAIGRTELSWNMFFTIAMAAWLVAGIQCLFAWLLGRTFRWVDPITRSGFLLVVAGINCGNFGLPMNKIAFGDEAAAYATIYYVAWTLFIQVIGPLIAARSSSCSKRKAVAKVAKMPLPYAAIAGILWNYLGLNPFWLTMAGKGLFQGINFIGSVAPFTMLFILGTGLYRAGNAGGGSATVDTAPLGAAVAMRMVAGPIIAFAITQLFQMQAITQFFQMQADVARVIILQSAMPTALQALMISESAEGTPRLAHFVRSGIVATTLLSMVSLPLLITLIR